MTSKNGQKPQRSANLISTGYPIPAETQSIGAMYTSCVSTGPQGLKVMCCPTTQQPLIPLSMVPRLESQETTEALLAVPAAGQHLVPVESGSWLQIIIAKLIPNSEILEKYVESHPSHPHNWIHL